MSVEGDLPATNPEPRHPSFTEAFWFWLKLGLISFGGPTGQIAIMHSELVEKKRWISEDRFLHALNFCMLLPGPEAQQLATYIGWLLHKTWGGVVAGGLFVLPSMLLLWALSLVYVRFGAVPWIAAVFYGLKPAVVAIVVSAVLRIGTKALKNRVMWLIAAAAFVAIFWFKTPFPALVLTAASIGFLGGRFWPALFSVQKGHAASGATVGTSILSDDASSPEHTLPSAKRSLKMAGSCLALWWLPVVLVGLWLGPAHALFQEALFFSKAAMVTFGGAYAVLPYVAQQAVESFGWLAAPQMLDGLALAETTPGPLIMVLEFVGFLGGWNHPGPLSPLISATLGALITVWCTFLPCFLWIFLGAPYIEQLRGNTRISTALSAVTAAVVGVILNLALWFAANVFFPESTRVDVFAIVVAAVALIGMIRWKWGTIPVVLATGALGILWKVLLFNNSHA